MNTVPADRAPHASRRLAVLSWLSRCSAVSASLLLPAAISMTFSNPVSPAPAVVRRALKDVYRSSSSASPWLVPSAMVKIRPRLIASAPY